MNTNTDLAWAAGIIDGEGCVTIHKFHTLKRDGRRSRDQYQALLAVSNTDPRMVLKLRTMFGGIVRCKKWKVKACPNNKPVYTWRRTSWNAARVITEVRPYLVAKADQADVLLAFQSLIRRHGNPGYSKALGESDWEQRRQLFDSIKSLKTPAPMEGY